MRLRIVTRIAQYSWKDGIRKYTISASQMLHLDSVNDTFRNQKQYV